MKNRENKIESDKSKTIENKRSGRSSGKKKSEIRWKHRNSESGGRGQLKITTEKKKVQSEKQNKNLGEVKDKAGKDIENEGQNQKTTC